jgi:hypothetical protein
MTLSLTPLLIKLSGKKSKLRVDQGKTSPNCQ